MTTDLDPYFAALRHDGDGLPSSGAEAARRRGRHRTLRVVASAAVGVLMLAGGLGVALRGGDGKGVVPHPATSSVVPGPVTPFEKLRQVGQPIAVGGTTRFATVATGTERAFVGRQTESGELIVSAVDLATGKAAWGPTPIATFGDAAYVIWHPKYVIASGRHDNGTRPDGSVTVLDQATGKVLMRVDVDDFESDHMVIGEELMIIDNRPDRTIRAYELATGRVRWTLPDGPSATVHLMPDAGSAELDTVNGKRGQLTLSASFGFTRLVQVTADGTAIVLDAATGRQVSRHPLAAGVAGEDQHDEMLAVDGVLYTASRGGQSRLRATDLRSGDGTRTLYTGRGDIHGVTSCGPGALCVTEYSEGGPDQPARQRTVSIDTDDGGVRWEQDIAPRDLDVVNGLVLTADGSNPDGIESMLIDPTGRQLLSAEGRKGNARWVEANAVLLLRQKDGVSLEVLGVSPVTADPVLLGSVDAAQGCGWNATHLVCVGTKGIQVWLFAK